MPKPLNHKTLKGTIPASIAALSLERQFLIALRLEDQDKDALNTRMITQRASVILLSDSEVLDEIAIRQATREPPAP